MPLTDKKTQAQLWPIATADIIRGVRRAYEFKENGDNWTDIFDGKTSLEELYKFMLTPEFKEYFLASKDELKKCCENAENAKNIMKMRKKR